jgi:hypothetical protein
MSKGDTGIIQQLHPRKKREKKYLWFISNLGIAIGLLQNIYQPPIG